MIEKIKYETEEVKKILSKKFFFTEEMTESLIRWQEHDDAIPTPPLSEKEVQALLSDFVRYAEMILSDDLNKCVDGLFLLNCRLCGAIPTQYVPRPNFFLSTNVMVEWQEVKTETSGCSSEVHGGVGGFVHDVSEHHANYAFRPVLTTEDHKYTGGVDYSVMTTELKELTAQKTARLLMEYAQKIR